MAKRNFPIGTFFDENRNKVYMLFRQGQAYTHDLSVKKSLTVQELTHKNFGSAFVYNNDILIVKSSGEFLFFKMHEEFE